MDIDHWDLEAVVRGCCFKRSSTTATSAAAITDSFSSFPPLVLTEEGVDAEKDLLFAFPDIMDTETSFRELENLCQPFFLKPHQQPLQQQQTLLFPQQSRPSFSFAVADPSRTQQQPSLPQRPVANTPRCKKRKNQHKRIVCHVPADGLSSDMWAWRKYGQKPIKGSPYPRGYYRCSSSKGCLARKQVERSRTDPAMLVVTYTAEHNHPLPTHRNSLAGSTRKKLHPALQPAATSLSTSGGGADGDQIPPPSSPSSTVEDEHPRQRKGEEEENEEGEEVLTMADMEMLGEEDVLFLGLEALVERAGIGAAKSPAISDFHAEEGGNAEQIFCFHLAGKQHHCGGGGGGVWDMLRDGEH